MKIRKLIVRRIIYKTTNNINGKIYIGKTTKNDPNYLGSGKIIAPAIKKYGKENFTREEIDMAFSKQELNEKEIFWIKFYDSRNPEIGYNIAPGGEGAGTGKDNFWLGRKHGEGTKIKMGIAKKGKPRSEETKNKIAATNREKAKDPKWIAKQSAAQTGKIMSKEACINMSIARKGKPTKPHSPETKAKIGEISRKRWANPEFKENMRIIQINRWKKRKENKKNNLAP